MNIFNPKNYDNAVIGAGNRVRCTGITAIPANTNSFPAKSGKVSRIHRAFNLIQIRALTDVVQTFTFSWLTRFPHSNLTSPLVSFYPFSTNPNHKFTHRIFCFRFKKRFIIFSDRELSYRLNPAASDNLLDSKASFILQFLGGNYNAFD
jgi:hypothetical protein